MVKTTKKLQQKMKVAISSQSELNAMIENVPMAVFLVDKERRVRRANLSATKFVGTKNRNMTGLRAGEALRCLNSFHNPKGCGFSPECRDCLIRNTVEKTFKEKKGFGKVEAKIAVKNKRKIENLSLLISTSLVNVSNEHLSLVYIEDITRRKKIEKSLQETRDYLEKLISHANAQIIVWNPQHEIMRVNHAFEQMTGYLSRELIGKKLPILFPKESEKESMEKIILNAEGHNKLAIEIPILHKDGQVHTFLWSSANIYDNYYDKDKRKLIATIAQGQDITEQKRKEAEIIRLNQTLKAKSNSDKAVIFSKDEAKYLKEICRIIIEDCGYAMMWIGFAEKDEEKSVRPVASYGFEEGYLETLKITWSSDSPRGNGPTGTAVRTGKISTCRNMLTDPLFKPWRKEAIKRGYASSIVFPLKTKDEILGSLSIYSRQANPFSESEIKILSELSYDVAYGITYFRLRAANKKAEKIIKYSSTHDVLSGVYNRYFFEKQLQKFRKMKKFNGGVIMVDVNGLKKINDTFGHLEGDKIIKKTADLLVSKLRKKDLVARFGGDEFCVLLPNTDSKEIKILASRLKTRSHNTKNNKQPSISIGNAYAASGKDIDDAIKRADELMYKNKKLSKM